MEFIGEAEAKHNCWDELPKRKMFHIHPDRVRPGTLVKCSCGETYVWEYHLDGSYGWRPLNKSNKWKAKL